MQEKNKSAKSNFHNKWLLLAKLLSLLIIVYNSSWLTGCRQNSTGRNLTVQNQSEISATAININTASLEELEKLPRVGAETAAKIIEHRNKYGAFRRSEDLILVRGMSDKKFREIRNLIKVE